jgi:sulfide:quinone oxidoreductase
VTFRRETVTRIDPAGKRVTTDQGTYDADILVVALGADYDLGATPGLLAGASEFYSVDGAASARDDVASFAGGNVVIAVTTPHFKCPPAPNEAALLMHDYLTRQGLREKSTITIVSPMPSPLPVSQAVADSIQDVLTSRGIRFQGASQISRFDPGSGLIHIEGREPVHYDLALAVPVHRPPDVIASSGLGTAGGWVQVEARTLKTAFPDVYAIGDVAAVGVPRAGVFSEGQAKVVARQIIDTIRGERMSQAYDGAGICYVEMGGEEVGRVDVNFLSGAAPWARFSEPTPQIFQEKRQFGSSRSARWFGNA